MCRCTDFLDLLQGCTVAGALSRCDDAVGIEEGKVARQFIDAAIRRDGMVYSD